MLVSIVNINTKDCLLVSFLFRAIASSTSVFHLDWHCGGIVIVEFCGELRMHLLPQDFTLAASSPAMLLVQMKFGLPNLRFFLLIRK